jgi:hypothetical protein
LDCSDAPGWAHFDGVNWLLDLHVQPGAKQDGVVGQHGDRLKLKISAPPVDNKANAHLLRWLAVQLGVPKSGVKLIRGDTSRLKTVAISGADPPWRLLEKKIKT